MLFDRHFLTVGRGAGASSLAHPVAREICLDGLEIRLQGLASFATVVTMVNLAVVAVSVNIKAKSSQC